ncbi:MAG: Cys-tRNA(Pro) deacylase [Ilumatobacteraceae bacterium]
MTKKTSHHGSRATPAVQTLSRAGVPFTIHTFEIPAHGDGAGYGMAAASALGVEPDRVFKTLVVAVSGSAHPHVVAIVPVSRQVNLKALAHVLSAKRAELLDGADAERLTGYVVGGISPFGQKRVLPTVIDASARSWPSIFVSAGRRNADVEVRPEDAIAVLEATVAEIAERGWT